jgi:2-desacetyl-2-hydroxyethyl bacteriochlorophyllide A dehydrogenase
MKAVRLIQTGQPLKMQEITIPTIGEMDVLVQVKAAGICHSDVHYREGRSSAGPLPITLGHEVSGVIAEVGRKVNHIKSGDRVCIHYMLTCNRCYYCLQGANQFCTSGRMIGKSANGGFAEYLCVPAQNTIPLPDAISYEHGAVLMCSSITAYHALRKARLSAGESVAVYGLGGLGISALQLAKGFGALDIFAVDINKSKLALAEKYHAITLDATHCDPVAEIRQLTKGKGVDVSIEVIGLPITIRQAVQSLSIYGRAVIAGISEKSFELDTYRDLLWRETEIIGCADHQIQEIPKLMEMVLRGWINTSDLVTSIIKLDEYQINAALDELDNSTGSNVRTVVVP